MSQGEASQRLGYGDMCDHLIFYIICRSNFLKLDVYYAALQTEIIHQVPTYGVMNFLGNTDNKTYTPMQRLTLLLFEWLSSEVLESCLF